MPLLARPGPITSRLPAGEPARPKVADWFTPSSALCIRAAKYRPLRFWVGGLLPCLLIFVVRQSPYVDGQAVHLAGHRPSWRLAHVGGVSAILSRPAAGVL